MVQWLPELMLLWECSHFSAGSIHQGWFGAVAQNFWSASADMNLMEYGQLRMVSEIVGLATQPETMMNLLRWQKSLAIIIIML